VRYLKAGLGEQQSNYWHCLQDMHTWLLHGHHAKSGYEVDTVDLRLLLCSPQCRRIGAAVPRTLRYLFSAFAAFEKTSFQVFQEERCDHM